VIAGKACEIFSREQYANIELLTFHFWRRSLKKAVGNHLTVDAVYSRSSNPESTHVEP
jgi:hypothetical protein